MRTLTTIILLVILSIGCATSQEYDKDFTDFYNQYEDDAGIICFQLPGALVNFAIDKDDKNAKELFSKVDKIRFVISENTHNQYDKKIEKYLPNSLYHDLMIIKDDGAKVMFKVKESKKGLIEEIIMTVSESDSFVAISFSGKFNTEDAQKMTGSIKSGKMSHFRM